jgi:hypothetical protein
MTGNRAICYPLPRSRGRVREEACFTARTRKSPLPAPPPQAGEGEVCDTA